MNGNDMNGDEEQARELAREFVDEEYRRNWAEDFLDTSLALQIAALRLARGWKQSDLARKASTTQSAISRMEDVEYGAHSIRVLKQLAAAFDLRLKVSFEEFGSLIGESGAFSEAGLNRNSFHADVEIARLLKLEGLELPPVLKNGHVSEEAEEAAIEPDDVEEFANFDDEFAAVLARPVEDRIVPLIRWLRGYGLPHQDEPAHKALYYALPRDARHGDWAKRLAEACAECLAPERFGEMLSDPDGGDVAAAELFRVSANLPAGYLEIGRALRSLLPMLKEIWESVSGRVRLAAIDLVAVLGELEMAEELVDWGELLTPVDVLTLVTAIPKGQRSQKLKRARAEAFERHAMDREVPIRDRVHWAQTIIDEEESAAHKDLSNRPLEKIGAAATDEWYNCSSRLLAA
jgi:transcriptional regulator with XRE-family HTH domain